MRRAGLVWLLLPSCTVMAVFFAAYAVFTADSLLHLIPGTATLAGPPNLHNYALALQSALVRRVAVTTLRLSAELTVLTILFGYPLAFLLARSPSPVTRNVILFVLVVVFLSGGVTRAFSWLIILGNNGLINSLLRRAALPPLRLVNNETGVVISLLHFLLPFFVLTLFGALKNISPALEEAARNLGGTRWQAALHVTLPLSAPGLVGAAMLVFTLALSSFLFPLLLGGGRVQMAANLIYDKMLASFDIPGAGAMALLFLMLALGVIALFSALQHRLLARRR
jgi:putative spermidine/putrescine transport system permease protein